MGTMEASPGEAGAIRHRFTVKHIDASKGSAAGYIAKYIGKKASDAAKR